MAFVIVIAVIVIGVGVALTASRTMSRTVHASTGGRTTGPSGWAQLPYTGAQPTAAQTIHGEVFPGTHADAHAAITPAEQGVAEIQAHDPSFDEEGFLESVQRAFLLVQQAWTERRPEVSRQVMADGIWQKHAAQIQEYINENKRNVLEDLTVSDITIVSAHSDQTYDTITVKVMASCADYDVDDKSGKVVRGNRNVLPWQETWTFQRSSDAVTKLDGGTMNSHCPNCGAPLDLDLQGVCKYCHAAVMGGKYDWVLSRISQVR
jgi:predicted lipid-binding transport protein (Tim44 family)